MVALTPDYQERLHNGGDSSGWALSVKNSPNGPHYFTNGKSIKYISLNDDLYQLF